MVFKIKIDNNKIEVVSNEDKGYYSVLMPYLGNPLNNEMFSIGIEMKMPNNLFLEQLFQQSLEQLDLIHSKGIIHGDLKPENILYDENNKKITIIDFGLSAKGNIDCINNLVIGSPYYRSLYVEYIITPLCEVSKRNLECFTDKIDDFISLYYIFLDLAGIQLPWIEANNVLKEIITFDRYYMNLYKDRTKIGYKLITSFNISKIAKIWLSWFKSNSIFSILNTHMYKITKENDNQERYFIG